MQFNHLPQRINAVILCLKGDKPGMTPVADMNGFDGRGAIGNRLPDAAARELLASALRQGDSASVKSRMARRLRRNRFDQMDRQLTLGQGREGQRQRRSRHASANDDDTHARAAAISASISSAFFTTDAVRFSLPVSVITMSSSIRMPIPRYSTGTSASGAI